MKLTMTWYDINGKDNDVVISSRVRLARNIADYPFPDHIDSAKAKEVIGKFRETAGDDYKFIDFESVSPLEAASYVEKHYISPEFAQSKQPHALLLNEEKGIAAMLCEEDHLRLQCIKAGYTLSEAFDAACEAEEKLCAGLNIAFDDKLGYLTHCPTNLGTAMRASVMLFLPALTMTGKLAQLTAYLPKVGYTIRGIYGEGSRADGYMYQLSNRATMGNTEQKIIEKLTEVSNQIISAERKEREALRADNTDQIEDAIMRSFGILKYARMLSSGEFMKLQSDVSLGIAMGIIKDVDYATISKLVIETSPATISLANGGKLDDNARDHARAKLVRETLEKA